MLTELYLLMTSLPGFNCASVRRADGIVSATLTDAAAILLSALESTTEGIEICTSRVAADPAGGFKLKMDENQHKNEQKSGSLFADFWDAFFGGFSSILGGHGH